MRSAYAAVTAALFGSELSPSLPLASNAGGSCTSTGFLQAEQSHSAEGKANCIVGTVHVSASASNTEILLTAPRNNSAVTEFYVELTQANSNLGATAVGGPHTVSGTYGIYTKLCFPADPAAAEKVTTLQVLTHGGTLDHTYWDIAPGYSYVDAAVDAGYATLAYDRLGSGLSDHPDPVQVVQLPLQIGILHVLVQRLRNAEIGGYAFKNVVGVGHSVGSALTQGVTVKHPKDFDALIMQGTSINPGHAFTGLASEDLQIANTQNLPRFKDLADGYHTPADNQFALQFAFYRHPGYDPKIFALQASNKQTLTIGETFTLGPAYAPATAFTGPVNIVNGQNDYFYCGGDCSYPTDQAVAALAAYFPSATKSGSQTFLVPLCGHNVNPHYSAGKAFKQMLAFLRTNGIF